MLKEFKEFINKGGVFEAAVGLIMALAFKPIVDSLVADVIMPIVARVFGQPDFSSVRIDIGGNYCSLNDAGTEVCGPAYINIGSWINTVISFVLVAIVIFMMVKAYNRNRAAEEEAGPSEVDLLTEIRDSLAK